MIPDGDLVKNVCVKATEPYRAARPVCEKTVIPGDAVYMRFSLLERLHEASSLLRLLGFAVTEHIRPWEGDDRPWLCVDGWNADDLKRRLTLLQAQRCDHEQNVHDLARLALEEYVRLRESGERHSRALRVAIAKPESQHRDLTDVLPAGPHGFLPAPEQLGAGETADLLRQLWAEEHAITVLVGDQTRIVSEAIALLQKHKNGYPGYDTLATSAAAALREVQQGAATGQAEAAANPA